MEEKIWEILNTLNQKFDQVREELRQEFKQENEKLVQKMEQKIDQKIDALSSEVNHKFNQMEKKLNHLSEEVNDILDKQVVFEDEYGTKIDAMFDYVQFHQKTNLERFGKMDELEKRISTLERKTV